jgi:hypothetical protein
LNVNLTTPAVDHLPLPLALVFAAWTSAFAQQPIGSIGGGVVGYVTAQATGEPLSLADVAVEQLGLATFATTAGIFRLRGLPAGPVTIRVRRIGFRPAMVNLTIVAGRDDTVRVALVRVALELERVRVTDALCPHRPGGDTVTLAILDQIQMNAERNRLLARAYPFVSSMERTIGNEKGASGRILAITGKPAPVDTILVNGELDWRYAPGDLIVPTEVDTLTGARDKMMVPQLMDFADTTFVDTHCFRYAGLTVIDSQPRIRVDFEPIKSIRDPDLRGSMYLDATSYQIGRTTLLMERRSPVAPATDTWDVRVDTWFREVLPALPVVDRICMRTTGRTMTKDGEMPMKGGAAIEMQRLIDFRFERDSPDSASRVVPSPAPTCTGKR